MATKGKPTKPRPNRSLGVSNYVPPPVPVGVVRNNKLGEEIMGWVAACVLLVFLLPLWGVLYMADLEIRAENKATQQKIERLLKEHERQKRNDRPESFGDNPVFDRTRYRLKDNK